MKLWAFRFPVSQVINTLKLISIETIDGIEIEGKWKY